MRIAQAECDVRDRYSAIRQSRLGELHASLNLILVGRDSERLLECTAEVVNAEPGKLRKLQQADLLTQMLLYVLDHDTLLPTCETSAADRCRLANRIVIRLGKLVRKHAAERLEVRGAIRLRALDCFLQFGGSLPDQRILEVYPRGEPCLLYTSDAADE